MTRERWTGSSTPYIESGNGDTWSKEAAEMGGTGTQRILAAGSQVVPRAITEALHLEPGTAVIARQRLILLDGQPVEVAWSHWPAEVASGTPLAGTGKIRGGAVTLLAELGYRPGNVNEEVQSRPPTREEVEALQLADDGAWVLTLTRTITTPDGRPYEVSVMVNPGRTGRLRYSMEVD